MIARHYLDDVLAQLRKYKLLADRAIAQISEEQFLAEPGPESNSIALIVKHTAGNMRSRWRDFLTSDGEKPDRNRDSEFILEEGDTRESLLQRWEAAWALTLSAIASLHQDDLSRTVTIRGEPHTVLEAINRQLTHYAYHVGQIVWVARQYAGSSWQSLSIPRGQSREYDVAKSGAAYAIRAEDVPRS